MLLLLFLLFLTIYVFLSAHLFLVLVLILSFFPLLGVSLFVFFLAFLLFTIRILDQGSGLKRHARLLFDCLYLFSIHLLHHFGSLRIWFYLCLVALCMFLLVCAVFLRVVYWGTESFLLFVLFPVLVLLVLFSCICFWFVFLSCSVFMFLFIFYMCFLAYVGFSGCIFLYLSLLRPSGMHSTYVFTIIPPIVILLCLPFAPHCLVVFC